MNFTSASTFINSILGFFFNRFREPSSVAGVGLVVSGAHELSQGNSMGTLQVVSGVLALVIPENPAKSTMVDVGASMASIFIKPNRK